MQAYRIGSYILTFIQVIVIPFWISSRSYMKDAVEKNEKNQGKNRGMRFTKYIEELS